LGHSNDLSYSVPTVVEGLSHVSVVQEAAAEPDAGTVVVAVVVVVVVVVVVDVVVVVAVAVDTLLIPLLLVVLDCTLALHIDT